MYDCNMIISAIFVIPIFRRTKHIYRSSILRENSHIISDKIRYAFVSFTGRYKRQLSRDSVCTLQAFTSCRFTE